MDKFSKYVFEILAIFIGISASFIVDEWREDRELSGRLAENLKAIREELVRDTISIDEKTKWFDSTASILNPILLKGSVEAKTPREMANILNSIIWTGIRSERSDAFYRALMNSSHVHYIENVTLKSKLSHYYENIKFDILSQEENDEVIAKKCLEMMMENCRTWPIGVALNLRNLEALDLATKELNKDFNQLLRNQAFKNWIDSRVQTRIAFSSESELGVRSLPFYKKYVRDLIESIDQELSR